MIRLHDFQFQVHADASSFASNVTKEEAYRQVLEQAEGLFIDQRNWVCLLIFPWMDSLCTTHNILCGVSSSLMTFPPSP